MTKIVFAQGNKSVGNGYSTHVAHVYENGLVAYKTNYNGSNYYQEFSPPLGENKGTTSSKTPVKKISFCDRSFSAWGRPKLKQA